MSPEFNDRPITPAERLLLYQTLERVALRGGPPEDGDDATMIALGIVLSTCHSCGEDLPERSEELLCPRCLAVAAQRVN